MNRLSVRLSLAFLCSAWIGIAAMMFVVQRTLDDGFRQYVMNRDSNLTINPDQLALLTDYYATNGSWAGAESVLSGRGVGSGGGAERGTGRGAVISIVGMDGVIAASSDGTMNGTFIPADRLSAAQPIVINGDQVGWLYRETPGIQALGSAEVAFLEQANRWITITAIGSSALALVVGMILAWTLANPLRELTRAVRDLSVGQLGRQVQVRGTVEVNALAAEFNVMSRALANAESLRQRMAADVAHELRTPVSVLRGHLEAMLDGVYPLDSAHIVVAHDQTIHLARLVEDLRVLTLMEAKRLPLERTRVDSGAMARQMLEAFEPLALDAEIRITHEIAPELPEIVVDLTRIRQVLSNLLTNALRYTPSQGEIRVRVTRLNEHIRFIVSNTGATLSQADVAHIFQPFWRANGARERDSGGSGLGLAISREIVVLHEGAMGVNRLGDTIEFYFDIPIAHASAPQ